MKNKKNNKTRNLVAGVLVALLVSFIGFRLYANKEVINDRSTAVPEGVGAMPVKVATAELRNIDSGIRLTGSFEARKTLPLVAEAQGSIIQLSVKEGQRVSRGQIIARIDPTAIRSNLASAEASFNNAVKNKERYERLVEAGAISQKLYEDVALSVDNAQANVTSIKQQMKYTVVNSPMSGIVGEVKVEQGSFATMGMQLGSVVDVSKLKMVLKVPEEDVIKVRRGQPVTIETDVYPGQTFKGNITLIGVQADEGRKYDVEVEVNNAGKFPLKAGMFGTAMLDAQNTEQGEKLFIPRRAIVGSIKEAKVFILKSDSTVVSRDIRVQNQSGDNIQVLEGLKANEKVITTGQINLKDGQQVRVIK